MFEADKGANGGNGMSGAALAAAALGTQGGQPASGASQAANPANPANGSSAANSSASSAASSESDPAGSQATGSQAGMLTLTQDQLNDRIRRAEEKGKKAGAQAVKDERTEAEKMASMSDKERSEYEINKLKKQLDEANSKMQKNQMMSQARTQLAQDGVSISDEMLSMIVTTEAETTLQNVATYSSAVKASAEAMFAKQRQGSTPANGNGGGQPKEKSVGAQLAEQQKEAEKVSTTGKKLFTR